MRYPDYSPLWTTSISNPEPLSLSHRCCTIFTSPSSVHSCTTFLSGRSIVPRRCLLHFPFSFLVSFVFTPFSLH
ncbi:hypothetical protein BDV98DRAFT_568523 [Pterulicium gracile]|uniref:Uncharacterized protein n=1 Tax=Pterulicium gracile TaxID=1884261 RepID=A0A5C3QKY3_9AGAR|nr:hypothetical protein BDV98DRAFT_568523 [Pterula gracilis]